MTYTVHDKESLYVYISNKHICIYIYNIYIYIYIYIYKIYIYSQIFLTVLSYCNAPFENNL